MIVRTYGRRNRRIGRTFTDSLNDSVSDSLSQETMPSQDLYDFPFPSQGSSSFTSQEIDASYEISNHNVFDFDDEGDGAVGRSKKAKHKHSKVGASSPWVAATSTLMETQEFGEMMEHVDEVNFALDGLKKGQPVRIRRASLLSLLSISGTAQQRRLLRAQGMAKTIIDAILGLSFDDTPSNLAAAALFFVLTSDGSDEHILESPSCIRFLIKLLKPVTATANEGKGQKVGYKLLALCKDTDILRDTPKRSEASSAAIFSKVKEILVGCKEMKSRSGKDIGSVRPELNPKWMALLTMEKACLSKISFEDATGSVRKIGGNFKEKLREHGGLDAVFEVALNCHSVMEGWMENGSSSGSHVIDKKDIQSLVLLLKCLKIMENATFLSKDNQSHLLRMKRNLDSQGSRLSFTKLVISVIKILSELYLCKGPPSSSKGKSSNDSNNSGQGPMGLIADDGVENNEVICISSEKCSSMDWSFLGRSSNSSQNDPGPSTCSLGPVVSSSQTTTTSVNDSCLLKMRVNSSFSSSCSEAIRGSNGPVIGHGSRALGEISKCTKEDKCHFSEDSEDPFAFYEDDFEPSKWDLLSGKKKVPRTNKHVVRNREQEDGYLDQLLMRQLESDNTEVYKLNSINEEDHHSQEISGSQSTEEENSALLSDCLLTAVKVLMNLANENPIGCRQIASCGGLETMSSLIASHFPSFCKSLSLESEIEENSVCVELDHQNDRHLTDQELDFLVAILGLLVNLVEKDGQNRSRLAAASISLQNLEGLEGESHRDVIPLLCAVFLANRGASDTAGEVVQWEDEDAVSQGEKEAEKMIVEAYAALLLAFLSTESRSIRDAIAACLPNHNLAILVPVLERFVAFHLTLDMISPETHKAVSEVIESCRIP
ncbi:hypothetical protein SLEP1_g52882 [Rubroshorea leprosula]|uniref:Wings apart-like protein C-terminal domain-containing protein n=1 Tax=Rubroshorea leprosula TaxID=152421 RepID=A0AAV5MB49_9ROSI|nr:hypothetical protein SLEP1_g52882 [Rubroshorea leprosula]